MTVFSSAIRALFNDKNLAMEATFIPSIGKSKGQPKKLRVITRAPDVYQNAGQFIACTPSLVLEVEVTQCSSVSEGDRFIIDDTAYIVQGEPRRDSQRLIWQVDCYPS